jgi:GDP-L-fucose synthase
MNKDAKIYIAGHHGMVGSTLVRELGKQGFTNLLTRPRSILDLTSQAQVMDFFAQEKPDYVFLAAAKVGGIAANQHYPADFIRDNLLIQNNVIDAAYRHGTQKLLFLGSSCIYPKHSPQPIKEDYLLSGSLEPTNEWYAVAKIAGIKLCQAYRKQYGFNAIILIPTNLYGPADNFSLTDSHVLPAILRKMHEAKISKASSVEIWGSGEPRREFLYVDDLAEACISLMQNYNGEGAVNIGVGKDISIRELAEKIKVIVGFDGNINFDHTKPDGTLRKLLDISKLCGAGWTAKTHLDDGIIKTYKWCLASSFGTKKESSRT